MKSPTKIYFRSERNYKSTETVRKFNGGGNWKTYNTKKERPKKKQNTTEKENVFGGESLLTKPRKSRSWFRTSSNKVFPPRGTTLVSKSDLQITSPVDKHQEMGKKDHEPHK